MNSQFTSHILHSGPPSALFGQTIQCNHYGDAYYSTAPRTPPRRLEGTVPVGVGALLGLCASLMGGPASRCRGLLALLGFRGGLREIVGTAWGISGRPWEVPGGTRKASGDPRGGPGSLRKTIKFSEEAWGGPGAF